MKSFTRNSILLLLALAAFHSLWALGLKQPVNQDNGTDNPVTETEIQSPTPEPTLTPTPKHTPMEGELPLMECKGWGDTPEDSLEAIKQYSLYREFIKQDNILDALPHWRYVFMNATGARETPFVDGVTIYKYLWENTEDETLKAAYADTLMLIYNQRMACFTKTADMMARKALDMIKVQPVRILDVLELFDQALDMNDGTVACWMFYPYMAYTVKAEKLKKIDADKVLSTYFKILDKAAELDDCPTDKVDALMPDYLDCEQLMPIVHAKYDEAPDDAENLTKIFQQMRSAKCFDDPLFIEVTIKLFEVEPSSGKALFIAQYHVKNSNSSEAIKYYKEALNLTDDNDEKAELYLSIAKMYKTLGDYASARSNANTAASLKANWGEPYLLIGDLYASSGPKCGPGTGWDSQVVTWPALDKYYYAKKIDPSVTDDANKKIAFYSKYMPSKEECFFKSLNEGDPYSVGCWINETTTVRYGPSE